MTDTEALSALAVAATEQADGHFSIWRFTTDWKAALGTPNLCILGRPALYLTGHGCSTAENAAIPSFPTLEAAVLWAIHAGPDLGKNGRGPRWKDISATVRVMDLNSCCRCGKTARDMQTFPVHHIIPVYSGGSDRPCNLITLCPQCHMVVENSGVDFALPERCYHEE